MKRSFLNFTLCTASIVFLASFFSTERALGEGRVTIPADEISKIDLSKFAGTYSNSLGYITTISVKPLGNQPDLFLDDDYEVVFSDSDYGLLDSDSEELYMNDREFGFNYVDEKGNIWFYFSDDCDYNVCLELGGEIVFKKKKDGSYYLVFDITGNAWDYEDQEYLLEEITEAGAEDPLQAFCESFFPKVITTEVNYYEGGNIECEGSISLLMKKVD